MTLEEKLGQLIKTRRLQNGIPQISVGYDLGHKTGSMVGAVERGVQFPSLHTAIKIAKIVGLGADEIEPIYQQWVSQEISKAFSTREG